MKQHLNSVGGPWLGNYVTIGEVARRAGVSIATVSRVLNNVPRGVRAALRRRVLKAASELDYRPNALARSLHQKRTHTLGLLIPDIANSFFAEVTRGIEDVCRRRGYALFICNTDRKLAAVEKYIGVLREKRVDGIIIVGGATPGPHPFQNLHSQGIPVVVIGRYDVSLPAVRIDNVKGGWEAATHLIRLGHRRIAIILGPRRSTNSLDVMKGYKRALAEHGILLPKGWVLRGDARPASALPLAERLLLARPRPTALLAINDQMAIAAIRAAVNMGLQVPQEVSIVGYDGIELASYLNPALTTMTLPLRQMGMAAAENIFRVLTGEPVDHEVWFTPKLVVRESTGPPLPLA